MDCPLLAQIIILSQQADCLYQRYYSCSYKALYNTRLQQRECTLYSRTANSAGGRHRTPLQSQNGYSTKVPPSGSPLTHPSAESLKVGMASTYHFCFYQLCTTRHKHARIKTLTRWPFAKFVNSPYYSESKLCRGAVTVSFSKYLSWQSMHFLQRSTHFSKTCCRQLIASKFLASELPFFYSSKSTEIVWDEIWIEFCVRLGKSGSVEPHYNIRHTVQILLHAIFGLFQTMKRELRGKKFRSYQRSAARFREVGGAL
jgi:hypothetical protein